MSSSQELKCNQCYQCFTNKKRPLKMHICRHNICSVCLQDIKNSSNDTMQCGYCTKTIFNFKQQKFQINLLIRNKISLQKDKQESEISLTQQKNSFMEDNEQLLTTQQFNVNQIINNYQNKQVVQLCLTHNKQIEIVCLTDMTALCSMCALFVGHKQHKLITKAQFQSNLSDNIKIISQTKHRKYKIQTQVFAEPKHKIDKNIYNKLAEKRQSLLILLNKQIQSLYQSIKQLHIKIQQQIQNALDELKNKWVCQIQTLPAQNNIGKFIIKKQNQYEKWMTQCENLIAEIESYQTIGDKIDKVKSNGKIIDINKGQQILDDIEQTIQNYLLQFEKQLSQVILPDIKIEQLQGKIMQYKTPKKKPNFVKNNPLKSLIKATPKNNNKKANGCQYLTTQFSNDNSFIGKYTKQQIDSLSGLVRQGSQASESIKKIKLPQTQKKRQQINNNKYKFDADGKNPLLYSRHKITEKAKNTATNPENIYSKLAHCRSSTNLDLFVKQDVKLSENDKDSKNGELSHKNSNNSKRSSILMSHTSAPKKFTSQATLMNNQSNNDKHNHNKNQQKSKLIKIGRTKQKQQYQHSQTQHDKPKLQQIITIIKNQQKSDQQLRNNKAKGDRNKKESCLELTNNSLNDNDICYVIKSIFTTTNDDDDSVNNNDGNSNSNNNKQNKNHLKYKYQYVKLNGNQMTTDGFAQIIGYFGSCTNLNISGNNLDQRSLDILLDKRHQLAPLRLVNLTRNNIDVQKVKLKVNTLKKMGILVHL